MKKKGVVNYKIGVELFSKLGDSIYFEEEGKGPILYIMQYISSSFNWRSDKILLNQTVVPVTSWDPYPQIIFTFSLVKVVKRVRVMVEQKGEGVYMAWMQNILSTLNFQIPTWTRLDGAKRLLNVDPLSLPNPGNFLSITRQWSGSDKLALQLPLTIRTKAIKDDRPEYASVQAILYGPYLLAGHTATGDWNLKAGANDADWITPIPAGYNSQLATFRLVLNESVSKFLTLANSKGKSDSDATFNQATSFVAREGLSQYNPISLWLKGKTGIFFWSHYSHSEMNIIQFISIFKSFTSDGEEERPRRASKKETPSARGSFHF
ncbi:hypothetical protein VNO78_00521 [Psophocarpus tetragonolobus]|uniref:Non-reducing end beta-L-arabinofuranosidase-like GH127 middle domain-containing protein n=1 Tax=Psophocarpus tetragonolobus TaxID=3891 RepID=A0AAN9SXH3_PSOTE